MRLCLSSDLRLIKRFTIFGNGLVVKNRKAKVDVDGSPEEILVKLKDMGVLISHGEDPECLVSQVCKMHADIDHWYKAKHDIDGSDLATVVKHVGVHFHTQAGDKSSGHWDGADATGIMYANLGGHVTDLQWKCTLGVALVLNPRRAG